MGRHHESIKGTLPWQVPQPKGRRKDLRVCVRCGYPCYTHYTRQTYLCRDCFSVTKSLGELHVWIDK